MTAVRRDRPTALRLQILLMSASYGGTYPAGRGLRRPRKQPCPNVNPRWVAMSSPAGSESFPKRTASRSRRYA